MKLQLRGAGVDWGWALGFKRPDELTAVAATPSLAN